MADNIYRVNTLDETYRVETMEEFYSSESYIKRKQWEAEHHKRLHYKHSRDLYEYLLQFNLSMQLMLNHIFGQRPSKKLYNAIIKINDPERLKSILYEISMYSKVFTTNAYPDVIQRCMDIIAGAIYSSYLEMEYDIWDLYSDVEEWGFSKTKGEYSSFNRIVASKYVRYFNYIVSGMEFEKEIDKLAKERRNPTIQFIKHYKKLHDEGEYLRGIAVKPYIKK